MNDNHYEEGMQLQADLASIASKYYSTELDQWIIHTFDGLFRKEEL